MTEQTPWWWARRDETFTPTVDLLMKLHIRAVEIGALTDASHLYYAWQELMCGPWQRGDIVIPSRVVYPAEIALVDELLARLQELTRDPRGRRAIARAHDHLAWFRPVIKEIHSLSDDED